MAGTNIGTATVNIVPSMKGFTSAINKAIGGSGKSFGGAGKGAGKSYADGFSSALSSGSSAIAGVFGGIASSLASTAIDAISSLTGAMVEASDSADKFASTLSFSGIDTSTIDALTKSTQEYADQTVYDLADIRNVTAQLAANGVDNYAQLAEAAGNLNAVAGGNASTFQSVGQVMTQTAGAGKLMTENWNQLTDAIPGASGALQQAMRDAGAFEGNFREAMENGEISADEFFAAVQKLGLTDVAQEAATSTATIEGAMGNLEASVVGLGSQVLTSLKPMITGAINELTAFISGIPAMLAPLGTAFMTALSGGGTGGIESVVLTMVTNMMVALNTALQQLFTQLPTLLTTYLPMITTAITSLFTALSAQLPTLVTTLATGITTLMSTIATQLPVYFQSVLPAVLSALTSLITSVVTQIPSLLMGFIGMVVSGISSFVSSIAAQLPVILPQLIESAMTALNDLITQILTKLPTYVSQMVDAAKELLQGIVDAIPEVLPKVVDGITELVQTVLEHLPSFLDSMMEAAVELFTAIVDAVAEILPEVLSAIGDLLTSVYDTVTSFDLLGAGKDLIQGLIDGILSMGGAVLDAIGGVVGDAIDWAKSLLGIGSPSKLFRQFGDWTMQGLALGIEDGAGAATRSMQRAMRDVYGSAGAQQLAAPSLAAPGAGALGGLAAVPSGGAIVNQTVNFNSPVQTPAQVAYAMKRYATYGLAGAR